MALGFLFLLSPDLVVGEIMSAQRRIAGMALRSLEISIKGPLFLRCLGVMMILAGVNSALR